MWVRGLKPYDNAISIGDIKSHPMWVRGLKLPKTAQTAAACPVAPYVGAWIETAKIWVMRRRLLSHPMWVRGLKPDYNQFSKDMEESHPMWVRGLKLRMISGGRPLTRSHPMWVRGLKQQNWQTITQKSRRTLCGCVD